MGKESIANVDDKRVCVYVCKGGAQVEGRRSHLKAMKDLTAGEDRNDNVCEGTQQTKSPNYIWHLTVCPLNSALCAHSVKSMKKRISTFMDLISHKKSMYLLSI